MRGGSGEWYLVANTMLDNLITQFHELTGFIQGFYNELIQVSRFKSDRAWALVGRCVGAVFKDQRQYHARAEKISSLTLVSGKVRLFSAVLKSHEVMEDFLRRGFRAHPLIVKEISLFWGMKSRNCAKIYGNFPQLILSLRRLWETKRKRSND